MSIDRKIDVTAMQFLLVQNKHQTHDWTLIGSDANEIALKGTIVTRTILYVGSLKIKLTLSLTIIILNVFSTRFICML